VERRLLAIYLTDHLAGATAGLELAKRARGSNAESELGDFLERLVDEIDADRASLIRVMDELRVGRDRIKESIAWSSEKVGRLKLNGRLTGYSPLSKLIELEGLHIGITGKLSLWESLRETLGPSAGGEDLVELAARAQRQRAELEPFRLAAAREAFAGESTRVTG
jgi:hypothetical protein